MGIAHELITQGWTQGRSRDEEGRMCLTRAARDPAQFDARPLMAIGRVLGLSTFGEIIRWNDDPNRTFDEVLRVAKEADELLNAS